MNILLIKIWKLIVDNLEISKNKWETIQHTNKFQKDETKL